MRKRKLWPPVTLTLVEAAHVTQTMGIDVRAKQNAQMMYECLKNSITDEAKAALASCDLDFHEDSQFCSSTLLISSLMLPFQMPKQHETNYQNSTQNTSSMTSCR